MIDVTLESNKDPELSIQPVINQIFATKTLMTKKFQSWSFYLILWILFTVFEVQIIPFPCPNFAPIDRHIRVESQIPEPS